MKKVEWAALLLLSLLLSSCAVAQEDGLVSPMSVPITTPFPIQQESPEPSLVSPAHDCDLENYYTIGITHEPEYDMSILVYDIEGREIYHATCDKGFHVDYAGGCILSIASSIGSGTMYQEVTYVDVHTGNTATYDNPVLAGNGVVCAVEPNLEKTKLIYKIYSMFESDKPLLEGEFEAAMWPIPHSAISNCSFWFDDTILLTYVLPDEENEKTIRIALPEGMDALKENRSSRVSRPSATPLPVRQGTHTPMPVPEMGMQEQLTQAFNHMVRRELDWDSGESPLKGVPKQEAFIKVYPRENSLDYFVFMALKDRILEIMIQNDFPGHLVYSAVRLYEGEMPEDTYEHFVASVQPLYRGELLDEFTYAFDPDCEFTYESRYFYIWEEVRSKIIKRERDGMARTRPSGDYTLLFCDYDEVYCLGPEEAGLVVISAGNGLEEYFYYKIDRSGITYMKELAPTEKQKAYYKAREFDRATVSVE